MLVTTPSCVAKSLGINDTILILIVDSSEKEVEREYGLKVLY